MDELDTLWIGHFGVTASAFERRLLAQVLTAIDKGDPLFVVTAMLTRLIYTSLGDTEKALLQFGPVLTSYLVEMGSATSKISSDLVTIVHETKRLERSISMLDARVIDRKRSLKQRVTDRAIIIVDSDLKTSLQWSVGLSLSFISGVASVCIWTP